MAKRCVLIVDDSKTAQVRLRKMLERFDVDVDTVNSAEEALDGIPSSTQRDLSGSPHGRHGRLPKLLKPTPAPR